MIAGLRSLADRLLGRGDATIDHTESIIVLSRLIERG